MRKSCWKSCGYCAAGYRCRAAANGKYVTLQSKARPAYVEPFSRAALLAALDVQPVVSHIHVSNDFFYYAGGVYSSNNCAYDANHAMLLVGYSHSAGDAGATGGYYVAQNSWGTLWGDKGFVRLRMAGDGPGLCSMYADGASVVPSLRFRKNMRLSMIKKADM
jgi:hypothetical protein